MNGTGRPPQPKSAMALRWLLPLAALQALGLWFALVRSDAGEPRWTFVLWLLAVLVFAAVSVQRVAALDGHRAYGSAAAALFGLWVLYFWQVGVTLFEVPRVLLPAPSAILQALVDRRETLAGDFVQTVLKAVLIGWAMGSGLGFAVGVAIDRAPFLQRGLLPLASLTSTVPLVAVVKLLL